jgi:hypothetical protein
MNDQDDIANDVGEGKLLTPTVGDMAGEWGTCPRCCAPRHQQDMAGGRTRKCRRCATLWDTTLDRRRPAKGAARYGQYYWCVQTPNAIVRVMADEMRVEPNGALLALQKHADGLPDTINFAWAAGQWEHFYGASVLDGSAVAVEHWDEHPTTPGPRRRSPPRRTP